jgi:hypothetical protein
MSVTSVCMGVRLGMMEWMSSPVATISISIYVDHNTGHRRNEYKVYEHGVLCLRCICFVYLKYIFNIFKNVKMFQTNMLCIYLHVLSAHEVV